MTFYKPRLEDFPLLKYAFECAKKGDKSAITVRDNYVKYLSESILNTIENELNSFNEKLILEDVNRFLKNRFPNLDEINRKADYDIRRKKVLDYTEEINKLLGK